MITRRSLLAGAAAAALVRPTMPAAEVVLLKPAACGKSTDLYAEFCEHLIQKISDANGLSYHQLTEKWPPR